MSDVSETFFQHIVIVPSTTHLRYSVFILQAISLLHQVVLQAPHLPDAYHTLGLVYSAVGDADKALGFYMLAAHLVPKDSSLWKKLISCSM